MLPLNRDMSPLISCHPPMHGCHPPSDLSQPMDVTYPSFLSLVHGAGGSEVYIYTWPLWPNLKFWLCQTIVLLCRRCAEFWCLSCWIKKAAFINEQNWTKLFVSPHWLFKLRPIHKLASNIAATGVNETETIFAHCVNDVQPQKKQLRQQELWETDPLRSQWFYADCTLWHVPGYSLTFLQIPTRKHTGCTSRRVTQDPALRIYNTYVFTTVACFFGWKFPKETFSIYKQPVYKTHHSRTNIHVYDLHILCLFRSPALLAVNKDRLFSSCILSWNGYCGRSFHWSVFFRLRLIPVPKYLLWWTGLPRRGRPGDCHAPL